MSSFVDKLGDAIVYQSDNTIILDVVDGIYFVDFLIVAYFNRGLPFHNKIELK